MEILNSFDGTVLSQTIWSLYNNKKHHHIAIMELLIKRGAIIKGNLKLYIEEQRKMTQGEEGHT